MKAYVQNRLEPSSGILHRYPLSRGSMLTSQDYGPSSVVYVPEPIAVFSIDRNAIGSYDFVRIIFEGHVERTLNVWHLS